MTAIEYHRADHQLKANGALALAGIEYFLKFLPFYDIFVF